MTDWLDLASRENLGSRGPLRMQAGWAAECGPLECARCRTPIMPGEQFFLAGRCSMGGVVPLGGAAPEYADVLEAHAEHVRCLPPEKAI
jgi:hypothetical protein